MELFKTRIEQEIRNGILGYWMKYAVDNEHGGFHGLISNDNIVTKDAEKGLIQNARNLWTFSRAYNHFKDDKYLEMANRAKEYLVNYFWDKNHGGFYWTVDVLGSPLNTRKQIYGQAFAIYGLSEYYIATKDEDALDYAKKTFNLIEKYSFDKEYNGYLEACSEEWDILEDFRLSPVDMNEKKSNNTHLHMMEAYTTLAKVWNDDSIKGQLRNIIEIMMNNVMDKKTLNFTLFFDEKWNKKSGIISYGHEIEASWLTYEALLVLGDNDYMEENIPYIKGIAENCYANYLEGSSGEMGMYNEDDGTGVIDKDKIWWVQAEACVGFYAAYQLTGKDYFLQAVKNIWKFIEDYLVDKENGEWLYFATDKSTKTKMPDKVMNWKSLYHNGRACIELLERIK